MRVVAVVHDLMDRSRLVAALPEVEFVGDTEALDTAGPADVVVIDLRRVDAGAITSARAAQPSAHIVGFGPHVDAEALRAARSAGADAALTRSVFFRDVAAAVRPGATGR